MHSLEELRKYRQGDDFHRSRRYFFYVRKSYRVSKDGRNKKKETDIPLKREERKKQVVNKEKARVFDRSGKPCYNKKTLYRVLNPQLFDIFTEIIEKK